jgi:transposase
VGEARHSPERSAGSAHRLDLYLRCHLPETGQGRGSDPARLQNLHLAEIAKAVAPGAHAVLLVDQAGWHLSARLLIPANITILALPPKCPELNPVENIWQYMRDNCKRSFDRTLRRH